MTSVKRAWIVVGVAVALLLAVLIGVVVDSTADQRRTQRACVSVGDVAAVRALNSGGDVDSARDLAYQRCVDGVTS